MAVVFCGFSGRPVLGGAGLKAPLVFDRALGQYSVMRASKDSSSWWPEGVFDEQEASGLITRVTTRTPFDATAVLLYAHMDFIVPPAAAGESNQPAPRFLTVPDELELHREVQSYLAFLPPSRAAEILSEWADVLLRHAKAALKIQCGEVAFVDAMRARFALSALSQDAVRERRLDAIGLACVAQEYRRLDTAPLERDAELDGFTRREVVERTQMLRPAPRVTTAPHRGYRDVELR